MVTYQITRHVAEIIQRQEFIMKLTRALMMFGGPSHRLSAQIQATARVLDIQLSCMYLPDTMLISFDDGQTGTSNVKFIRQGSALDLGKLYDAFKLYWKVSAGYFYLFWIPSHKRQRLSLSPFSFLALGPNTFIRSSTTISPYQKLLRSSTP